MVPDRQKVQTEWTDNAKTISLRLRRGITHLVEVHKVMLHANSNALGLKVSDKKIFSYFPYISLS